MHAQSGAVAKLWFWWIVPLGYTVTTTLVLLRMVKRDATENKIKTFFINISNRKGYS